MRPLSIIHVDTERTWRGGQEALLALARGLRERGHKQSIACPERSELAQRARAEGFPMIYGRSLLRADIVHAHSGQAQNRAFGGTIWSGGRRVVTRHVAFPPRHPWVHRLKYTMTAHGIIAVSHSVKRALTDAGVPAHKIEVIYTGIKVPEALPDAEARRTARARWGFRDDDVAIGHLGAFTGEKGQDIAVDAMLLLQHRSPCARLSLAGDGPLRKKLTARSASLRVIFPGFVQDRAEWYAALDVFVMPSRSESWGLAALEAMAYGVPVIASQVGGLPEMIEHGVSGWLVPPDDPGALAEALAAAAADRERLRSAGLAARERARLFTLERTVELTEALYLRLLSRRESAQSRANLPA